MSAWTLIFTLLLIMLSCLTLFLKVDIRAVYNSLKSNEMLLLFPGSTDMSYEKVASIDDLWDYLINVPGVIYTGTSSAAYSDIGVTYRG